jgi:hypothetical protein
MQLMYRIGSKINSGGNWIHLSNEKTTTESSWEKNRISIRFQEFGKEISWGEEITYFKKKLK